MENNLEDFLEEDLWKYFNSDDDAEAEEEYNNEYQDELAEEMNDESYYGRDAGEVLEELEEDLDGEETDDEEEDENYTSNNAPAIGRIGEIFAKKYLEELFKINGVDLKVRNAEISNDEHDLDIFGNGEEYLIEVKLSQNSHPDFAHIHFNNDFKYLFLIWKRNDNFYFSILSKEEAENIATEMHYGREEDNYVIQTQRIFSKDFLKELAIKLNIDKDLIDLTDERKLEIYEDVKNEAIEIYYKNIDMNTLTGKMKMLGSGEKGDLMQDELYKYLHYFDADTINNGDGDFDILYKNKRIEVKFSTINNKIFTFSEIKPEYFDFIFFIGIDENDNFYFDIESKDEYKELKIKTTEGSKIFSQNGSKIHFGKSSFNFGNHLTIEDIDNYIERHS